MTKKAKRFSARNIKIIGFISDQIKYLKKKYRLRMFTSNEEIFTHHYTSNSWGDEKSRSGPGSNEEYTKNIREKLPKLMDELHTSTLLDAPCGDHYWFKLIKWAAQIKYIGGDLVKSLIDNNMKLFSNENVHFLHLDIIHDPLPDADIWLCRDCFIHLSNNDIMKTLDNFCISNINYILLSNYPDCTKNSNIPTGDYRSYNLMLPPFNFPSPIKTIDDWIEGYPVRNLSLWKRSDLCSMLHKR